VQERLTREVTYWDHRASELQLQTDAGKSPRMNPDRAAARADELQRRKEVRLAELDREAQLASQLPAVVGGAMVVPIGLLREALGGSVVERPTHAIDTAIVERRAVDAVLPVVGHGQVAGRLPALGLAEHRILGQAARELHFVHVQHR